jgi:hypothetical protein
MQFVCSSTLPSRVLNENGTPKAISDTLVVSERDGMRMQGVFPDSNAEHEHR